MGFEVFASRPVRLQHSLDPLAQIRVLATTPGEVRGPFIVREFAGGIKDFLFAISVSAHHTKRAFTRDYAFSHSKRSHRKNLKSWNEGVSIQGRSSGRRK